MELDSALIGVVIGSILSLFGNFLNHWLSMHKEQKHWERQQKTEDKKREVDEKNKNLSDIKNIYYNCISRLSLIKSSKSDEAKRELLQEAFDWLALLALHQRDLYGEEDSKFHESLKNFIDKPEIFVGTLLNEVSELAMTDKALFPDIIIKKGDPDLRTVKINIDNNFRKKQMTEEAIELDRVYIIEYHLSKLTDSQRKLLWDIGGNKIIPNKSKLPLPKFNKTMNQIFLNGMSKWKAKLNPLELSPEDIFNEWEKDFKNALSQVEKEFEASQKQSQAEKKK